MIPNRSVLDWPTGVTVFKPEKCYNGYTVVTPYRSSLIFLIDMLGRVVHVWKADPERQGEAWFLRRLTNGTWLSLVFHTPHFHDSSSPDRAPDSFSKADFDSEVVELDWDGRVVWRWRAPTGWHIHHDMARLQNGSPFAWGRGTQVLDSGMYRAYRYGYDEAPEPDPIFENSDGHVGVQAATAELPEYLGLPSRDLP
ncbi:MAG: hypothetical protein ACE5JM_01700 [Armatimonadota bacterium]